MDYKETITPGEMKQWRRCENVVILNPYNVMPSIKFNEEDLITLPDGSVLPGPGVTDPPLTEVFDATDPIHGALYYYSNLLYIRLREARDAKMVADAEAVQP